MKRRYLRGKTLIRDLRELGPILRNGGLHDHADLVDEAADNIEARVKDDVSILMRRDRQRGLKAERALDRLIGQ